MKLAIATIPAVIILCFAAFWFMPGGALAMGVRRTAGPRQLLRR